MSRDVTRILFAAATILFFSLASLQNTGANLLPEYSSTTAGGTLPPVTFTTSQWSSEVHFAVYEYSIGDPIAGESGYQDFGPLPISVNPSSDPSDIVSSITVVSGEYLYVYQIDHDSSATANLSTLINGILVPALNTITSLGYTNDTDVDIFGLGSGDLDVYPFTDGPTKASLDAAGQAVIYDFAPFGAIEAGDESFTLFFTSTVPPRMHAASLYGGGADTQFVPSPDNDSDDDGVYDDGDFSGATGDNPCTGGNTTDCDDNCIDEPNLNQEDMDSDGVGDVCDLCPDSSDPDCIFLSDDFNDGNDDGWTRGDGTWAVEGGEYSADGGVSDIAISTVDYSMTTDDTAIEADYFSQPAGTVHNGFIIFDYQGPNDFKYAAAREGADEWRIGYYDGAWNEMVATADPIDTSRWYRMKVVIIGSTATLYVDDDRDGSGYIQMAQYTFTDVSSGMIGLAAVRSHAHFDNFDIYTPYAYSDDFNDGNDDGWTRGDGTWAVEGGEYSADGGVSDIAISTVDYSMTTDDTIIEADYFSQPVGTVHNGFIIFDYQGPNDFKYAAAREGADEWRIGYYDGTWNDVVIIADQIDTSRWYRMKVVIIGSTTTLYVDDDRDGSGYIQVAQYTFTDVSSGMIGLAAVRSHAHFDNFDIYTPYAYSDDFNDGNDDGWTQGDGTWAVEGGEYSADGGVSDIAISTVDYSVTTDDTVIEADYFSQPVGTVWNGFIIFDYQGPNDFKYAAAREGADEWRIGYYDGMWNDMVIIADPIDISRWYRMKVVVNGNTTTLYVDDDRDGSGYIQMAQYTFTDVSSGMIGLAAVRSHAHFDNFDMY